jgi:hypothetical protein
MWAFLSLKMQNSMALPMTMEEICTMGSELKWSSRECYFEAARPTQDDLNINITLTNAQQDGNRRHIDREATLKETPAQLSPEL